MIDSLTRRFALVLGLSLLPAAVLAAPIPLAAADEPLAGPVYFRNLTSTPFRLEAIRYVDSSGREVAISTTFAVKAGNAGYIIVDSAKVPAREFRCRLVSSDGATQIRWQANVLDSDGDFVVTFGDGDLREHRRLLGKATSPSHFVTARTAMKSGPRKPTDEEVGQGIAKILGAAVAHAVAVDRVQNGEGGLLDGLIIETARSARDAAIKSALDDLFLGLSRDESVTAGRMVCLALDGRLTLDEYNEQAAKDRLIEQLRAGDPDFAAAAEVADFIYRVARAARSR